VLLLDFQCDIYDIIGAGGEKEWPRKRRRKERRKEKRKDVVSKRGVSFLLLGD